MKVIFELKSWGQWFASDAADPEVYGTGDTEEQAMGDMVLSHKELFGVETDIVIEGRGSDE